MRTGPRASTTPKAESQAAPGIEPRTWHLLAAWLTSIWITALLSVALNWHPTPFYSVESDLIGTYIPAAQDLAQGEMAAGHYQSKGFGYPLLLAGTAWLARGDYFLAAKLLNLLSAVMGAAFAYLLFRSFLGPEGGFFVLAGLLLNPIFVRFTVEAGTDMPAFAMLMAATFLLLWVDTVWATAASGFIAGFAVITRTNCIFIVVAAALVLLMRPRRKARLAAYSAGLIVPVGAWMVAARGFGGSLFGDQNTSNVAYEIYGRGLNPDEFGATLGKEFHSMRDVLFRDPRLFASRIAVNIVTRHLEDAKLLMPVWLGALAVPGMTLGWWKRPDWPGMAIHFLLGYLVLVPVFYLPRFGLYLLPFYLSGVVALLLLWRPTLAGALRRVLLAGLFVACAFLAVANVRGALQRAPRETQDAGLFLRTIARPGDRVMARKPHAAYFAGMIYVPLPDLKATTVPALVDSARSRHAHYVFISWVELAARPQLKPLARDGFELPGLRQIAYRNSGPTLYAIYEVTGE